MHRHVLVVAVVDGCRYVLMLKTGIGSSHEGKMRKWRGKNELKHETVFWSRKWDASVRVGSNQFGERVGDESGGCDGGGGGTKKHIHETQT